MEGVNCPVCGSPEVGGRKTCLRCGTPLVRPKRAPVPAESRTGVPSSDSKQDDTDGDPFSVQRSVTIVAPDDRRIRLECGDRLRVGRSPDSPLADLCADNISWHHAEIYVNETDAFVADMTSTNGTFVDGAQVVPGVPLPLHESTAIRLGTDPPLELRVEMVTAK